MSQLPTAREVRDVLGHVDIGAYRVSRNASDQQQDFSQQWRVYGKPDAQGIRDIVSEHDTYRQAVVAARKRVKEDKWDRIVRYHRLGNAADDLRDASKWALEAIERLIFDEAHDLELLTQVRCALIDALAKATGCKPDYAARHPFDAPVVVLAAARKPAEKRRGR